MPGRPPFVSFVLPFAPFVFQNNANHKGHEGEHKGRPEGRSQSHCDLRFERPSGFREGSVARRSVVEGANLASVGVTTCPPQLRSSDGGRALQKAPPAKHA
jgi:hypothetical protein